MSTIAFLSDIHANIDALEAVLEDAKRLEAGAIICLGDTVGYGPEPAACVERVRENCLATVRGNHEAMLGILSMLNEEDFDPIIRDPLLLAQEQLSPDSAGWLRSLPLVLDMDSLVGVHASLNKPAAFHYICDRHSARENFAHQIPWHVSFHGHTHQPCIWKEDGSVRLASLAQIHLAAETKYSINVGSVGQPRDGDPRACYVLYEPEEQVILHRRVAYDVQQAQARFKKAGLPGENRKRIGLGR